MTAWATAVLVVVSVAGVFSGPPLVQAGALGAAILAACITDRRSLRATFRIGLLLTFLFSSTIAAAVVAWSSTWTRGFEQGVSMLLRLLVLVTLTNLLARNVDSERLFELTRRLGLRRLGLVLGLALNTLPQLTDSTREVFTAWRVRRRSDAGSTPSVLTLIEVLLAHVARIADDAAAAAALRGHDALLQRPQPSTTTAPVIVATGKPGTGKTTILLETLAKLKNGPIRIVGFTQPGIFENDRKVGFSVRDLESDETTTFARLVDRAEGQHGTRFQFSEQGFALAHQALSKTLPDDLLVIDELGPMELRGEGHMRSVQGALKTPGLRAAILVVRAHLVPSLLATLEARDAVIVNLADGNGRTRLEQALARVLRREPVGQATSSQ